MNISFRLGAGCPESIAKGRDYATVMGIKGANGSGKTHLLRAMSFLGSFCTASFESPPEAEIQIEPFFGSKEPTDFFVEFLLKENELYRYELSVDQSNVLRETLYRTKSRKTKIFERIGNEVVFTISSLQRLGSIKLRKNVSMISMAHQYEFDELKSIYRVFRYILTNVTYSGLRESAVSISKIAGFLEQQPEIFEFVKSFIKECDVGIDDIKILNRTLADGSKEYYPGFFHAVGKKLHPVMSATESSGTKTLFRQLGLYKLILDSGGLLVLDEFDINLHPHILPKLLGLFTEPTTNPKGAQVIFSTHQTDVLELLGRYRTYLVNKVENESFAYRLDEVPSDILRNDRPILPAYNSGKIGGVPRL